MEKIEINIKVDPLLIFFFPISNLNSSWSLLIIKFHRNVLRDGINHKDIGINKSPIKVLNQLIDKFIILDEGSKTENKLLIIFKLKVLWLIYFL